jgi:GAF domain-containing protein
MRPDQRLADVFIALAGSTANGPLDVPATLSALANCAPSLLGTRAATVVFAPDGYKTAQVTGSEPELFRLEHEAVGWREGPGHDCHQSGGFRAQSALEGRPARQRWPHYTPRALRLGYTRVAALPLREPTGTSGALVLLSREQHAFTPDALALGQSMADFTAVVLERAREADRSRTLATQLESALNSRVVIEQAKGIVATCRAVTLDEAFDLLRKHARAHQRPVRDVAREVVDDHEDPGAADPSV